MGNCHCGDATEVKDSISVKESMKPMQSFMKPPAPIEKVSIVNFKHQFCIGRGGFGKVWKVIYKKENKAYAMKEMEKARIMSRRSLNSVMAERLFLT